MPLADVTMGEHVVVSHPDLVNLYGCQLGDDVRVGPFVEIQRGCVVGPRCKISSHAFLCEGVTLEAEVFVGHGVVFTNDRLPRAAADGVLLGPGDWPLERTVVRRGASLGSNATIRCGVEIGVGAVVGCGAVVTRDVPAGSVVAGNPARQLPRAGEAARAAGRWA